MNHSRMRHITLHQVTQTWEHGERDYNTARRRGVSHRTDDSRETDSARLDEGRSGSPRGRQSAHMARDRRRIAGDVVSRCGVPLPSARIFQMWPPFVVQVNEAGAMLRSRRCVKR